MRPYVLALLCVPNFVLATFAQWTLQASHTTADLRGIDNVGHGIAWASGSEGTILRTLDSGEHWQLCSKPPNGEHLDFRAIQAFDNSTAIIMSAGKGDLSRLYKTTDGCQSWTLLFTNPDKDGFFDALKFDSSQARSKYSLAILVGDPVDGHFPVWVVRNADATLIERSRGPHARNSEAALPRAIRAYLFIMESGSPLVAQTVPTFIAKFPTGPTNSVGKPFLQLRCRLETLRNRRGPSA